MSIATSNYLVEWAPTGAWVDISTSIIDIDGGAESTGNRENALAFGDASESTLRVVAALALQSSAWYLTPIRATYTINAVTERAFYGVIASRKREMTELTFECKGFPTLVRATKSYSPMFHRRPVATKTTVASVENPTDPAYVAGPINWILWQSGGRPAEQDFAYPSAAFYYSCDQALLAPDWSWLAGENGWEEALKLVQAAGGQLFQAGDGVVYYRQPYALPGSGVVARAITDADYGDVEEQAESGQVMTKVQVSYILREVRPMQQVVEDTTFRLLPASGSITFDLEPQWPLYAVEYASAGQLRADTMTVCPLFGGQATLNTDFSHTITVTAQKITLTLTNLQTYPLGVYKIIIRGMPIVAGEAGSVTVGSGTVVKALEDNVYIQSKNHAERLANLYMAFYGAAHPIRTITGMVYDPDLAVGNVVTLTVAEWSVTAVQHVIVAIKHADTGITMDMDVVEVAGMSLTTDFFRVGVDYSAIASKLVGY